MIKKGTWIEIENIVLQQNERRISIPEETKKTPLVMWLKGYALNDCNIGEEAEIKTITGRIERGIVTRVEPMYTHSFGKYVKELAFIGAQARDILFMVGDINE